jgi:hypothetical protein
MLTPLNLKKSEFCQSIEIAMFASLLLSQNAVAADNGVAFFREKATANEL